MLVMKHLLRTILLTLCLLAFAPRALAGAPTTYVVQAGDTLFSIAVRYDTSVAAIKQLNKLNGDIILVGQKLLIPTEDAPLVTSSSYIVQPGDTLLQIALKHGTTMRALMQLNDLPNPNLISIGQPLAIPASATVAKPGLLIDPPAARQGGTLLIETTRPDIASISGTFNGAKLTFARASGYWYALTGISRCAKVGNASLTITTTNSAGQASTETAAVDIASTAFVVQALTLPPSVSAILSDQASINREAAQLATIVRNYSPARLWSGVFRQPVYGAISSMFGTRRSYNEGPVAACGHEGTDFAMPGGTPIYAPARGKVVFAGLTQVRGNLTVIDHGVGVFSAYYHQSEIDVKVGQMVEPGMLLGKIGTTGLSTGNHLHWSMWVNGEYIDPMEWTKRIFP
jgi:murein DD-endopeptidase MepM/ murein hydrolase activator NlpD